MRVHSLAILLGLTTAAVASTQLSVEAAMMSYQIQSGTTTLSLDNDLSPLGLSYKLDFDMISPSNDPGIVGTNFTFSYDDQTQAFTPLSGAIEHTGSVAFNVDQTQLALLPTFEIGDFSLEFDDAGYYLRDNVSTGQRLFDLKINNAPTFDGTNLLIEGADVAISQDFETILNNAAGYEVNLAGFTVAQARVSANATAVPEPEANVGISLLLAAGMAVTIRRRYKAKKLEF